MARTVELEFIRARSAADPFAFELGEQEYVRIRGTAYVCTASFDWSLEFLGRLTTLYRQADGPEDAQALGANLRSFLGAAGWTDDELEHGPVRISVCSAAAELYALPLELTTTTVGGEAFGTLSHVSFRYRWPGVFAAKPDSRPGGRSLVAWSSAGGAVPVNDHIAAVNDAAVPWGFTLHSDVLGNTSLAALESRLREAMASERPVRVLHILCHGVEIGATFGLALDGPDGLDRVSAPRLASVLGPFRDSLRLVVLCVCHGGNPGALGNHVGSVAQTLHRMGIPWVVASRFVLSTEGSVVLARSLFGELRDGLDRMDEAVSHARRTLRMAKGTHEWATVQLYAAPPERPPARQPHPPQPRIAGGITFLAGLFEFVLGKASDWSADWAKDSVTEGLISPARELEKRFIATTIAWKETLRDEFRGQGFDLRILWNEKLAIDPTHDAERQLAARLWNRDVPSVEELFTVLRYRYRRLRLDAVAKKHIPPAFLRADAAKVEAHLKDLAEQLRNVCVSFPPLGRPGIYKRIEEIQDSGLRSEIDLRRSTASIIERINRIGSDGASAPKGWVRVSFRDQRGIEAALSGESLGPRDVDSCPRLAEVKELHLALSKRSYAGIVGPSGCGKSMALFHVARDTIDSETTVYRLADPATGVTSISSSPDKKTALLVDDAHLLSQHVISALCDTATDNTKIIFADIDYIPGILRPIVVDTERAVAQLTEDMSSRLDEIRYIIQQIDQHVGEGAFDTSVESIIKQAARSKTPWQFMFVLGRGHLRSQGIIESLKRSDRADLILLIISMGQIARHDQGIERAELYDFARLYKRDRIWVDASLRAIANQGVLLREHTRITTPHPRFAMAVIALTVGDAWSKPAIKEHLRELLINEALPPRGRAWLIEELRFSESWVCWQALTPEIRTILHGQLLNHDENDEERAASLWLLSALMANRHTLTLIKATTPWLEKCIYGAGRASGYALNNVVNSIINNDREWGAEFVSGLDAEAMASRLVEANEFEFGSIVAMTDRLLVCGGEQWSDSFFDHLDHKRLAERWNEWGVPLLYDMASFSKFLAWRKTDKSIELLRSMYPTIQRAFRANVLDAWSQIREFILFSLGFAPIFDDRPSAHELELAREIGGLIEANDIGSALSSSRRRDWEVLALLIDWLRRTLPNKAKEIASFTRVEDLLRQARPLARSMPRDLESMFSMLILNEEAQPFSDLVIELKDEITELAVRYAILAPSVGIHVLEHNGRVRWGFSGAQPNWQHATRVLEYLEEHNADLAARYLESATDEIAQGLMSRYDSRGQHLEEFFSVVERFSPDVLFRICEKLDPEQSRIHWLERLKGTEESKRAVQSALRVVCSKPGPAQSVALELMS